MILRSQTLVLLICSLLALVGCADRAEKTETGTTTETFLSSVGDRSYFDGPGLRTSLYISYSGALRFKNKDCSYTVNGQILSVTKTPENKYDITYTENEIYRNENAWISDSCRKHVEEYRATLPKVIVRTACSYSISQVDFSCSENLKDNWILIPN